MSNPEDEGAERQALARLDAAVGAVLASLDRMRERVRRAEERSRELGELLERYRTGQEDPEEVASRAERLSADNERLRRRLEEGRDAVERILARIRFLEEQR